MYFAIIKVKIGETFGEIKKLI
ncbi:hypothetical protein A2U01_0085342, partial [Trifolium medium]|nr:hypothetical protein [Trifolium medium]